MGFIEGVTSVLVQALYYLQACIITVLVGLIVRYSIFCVRISGAGALRD